MKKPSLQSKQLPRKTAGKFQWFTIQVSYSDLEGGWAGTGNIEADPRFEGNGDFHLTWMSPCIDRGTGVDAPATDLDSSARDAQPDMGAYEWTGSVNFLPIILKN